MKLSSRLLVALAALLIALPARAQGYPDRPIRLIVPIAAGSVTDVIMRAAANELAPGLGQLVIENKGGASGIPGAQACAQAQPDGYTLCLVYHSTMSINPLIFDKLPYDADKDFVPITNLFLLVEGLFVNTSIAQELVAGQLQLAKMGIGNFLGLISTGKIKPLAVASTKRSPLLPDVPTFAEAGLPYPGFGWWGLAAPKGTPAPIVEKVNREFVKVFRDPKFTDFLDRQAVVPAAGTQAEFVAFLKNDRHAAEALVKIANTARTDYKPE
jgi:tripartite-type tricarboxylate transporter receptor subunit TctC